MLSKIMFKSSKDVGMGILGVLLGDIILLNFLGIGVEALYCIEAFF